MPEHQWLESLQVLAQHGYVRVESMLTNPVVDCSVTWIGWLVYAQCVFRPK